MRCFLAKEKALSKKLELGLRRALFISMTGLVSSGMSPERGQRELDFSSARSGSDSLFSRLTAGRFKVSALLEGIGSLRLVKTAAFAIWMVKIEKRNSRLTGVEPVISPAYNAGVLKGAQHPNVAYLFAIFLTTAAGQEVWEKYGGHTSAFVAGTSAYRHAQGKNVLYMSQNQAETVDRLAREYSKILGLR